MQPHNVARYVELDAHVVNTWAQEYLYETHIQARMAFSDLTPFFGDAASV